MKSNHTRQLIPQTPKTHTQMKYSVNRTKRTKEGEGGGGAHVLREHHRIRFEMQTGVFFPPRCTSARIARCTTATYSRRKFLQITLFLPRARTRTLLLAVPLTRILSLCLMHLLSSTLMSVSQAKHHQGFTT